MGQGQQEAQERVDAHRDFWRVLAWADVGKHMQGQSLRYEGKATSI